ncbi:hypothetical protein EGW08_019171 [Elysia chlorotica]|uniref:Ig-like domain-containing protein n=1 Tax=Elysia chlorotica TaxID=188477 RepID=A0A433SUU7_ELYCH|nr:hypothetical protein EGW08_019171 [Elysia chlorotica]
MLDIITTTLSIYLLSAVTTAARGCPLDCVCSGGTTETRAMCSSPNIKTIPGNLSPATEILTIQGVQTSPIPLTGIVCSDFSNLTEVIHLKISFTLLTHVAEDAFFNLVKLKRLELDNNRLSSILPNTFSSLGSTLALVSLFNNRGLHLHHRTFWNLPSLREIYLSGLGLHEIDPLTFYGLSGLRTLDLSANELTYLSPGVLSSMPNLWSLDLAFNNFGSLDPLLERFFRRLRRLQLGGNRWQCNCLLKWLKKYPALVSPSNGADPVMCAGPPSLEFSHLLDLDDSLLTCAPPNIVSCPHTVSVPAGESHTIKCLVTGDPYPRITWTFADGTHLASGSYPGMPLEDRAAIFIKNVSLSMSGTVTLTAHNRLGTETAQITLIVRTSTTTTASTISTEAVRTTLKKISVSPSVSARASMPTNTMLPAMSSGPLTPATQKDRILPGAYPTRPDMKVAPTYDEGGAAGASQPPNRLPQPENNIPAIAAASAAGGAAVILAAVLAVWLCSRTPFATAARGGKVAPMSTDPEFRSSTQNGPERYAFDENSSV